MSDVTTLRYQTEHEVTGTIYRVGMEVHEDPSGAWTVVYHARTYDGLLVASHYETKPQALQATTAGHALDEAAEGRRAFERLYMAACCGRAS
jgi:hypothetical protein